MCEKCEPIDRKIAHYKTLATHISDLQTLDGIGHLIQELEAQKLALHHKE